MRHSFGKSLVVGAFAAALTLAAGSAAGGRHAGHVPAELGGRRAERGLRRGRRGGLLQGRRPRRHARPGQRLGQHGAARRQRARAARVRRRGRGQPADRQGRADEDRVDDLPVEPERGDGAEEDRASSRSRTWRARRSACRPARRRRRCCRCSSRPTTSRSRTST